MKKIMSKVEIIEVLRNYKKEFAAQYGILEIGIFGSVARDEAGKDSDVDVVVRISKPDLFMLVGIKNELEERFQRTVDIVLYSENMNQFLKKKDRWGVCICITKKLPYRFCGKLKRLPRKSLPAFKPSTRCQILPTARQALIKWMPSA